MSEYVIKCFILKRCVYRRYFSVTSGLTQYRLCLKKVDHLCVYSNFSKFRPVFNFSPLNSEMNFAIKTTTSPQICCHTTLQNVTVEEMLIYLVYLYTD